MPTVGVATGGGRGMGLACARRLPTMVDVVVLVDRDEAAVMSAANELSRPEPELAVEPFVLDVTDRAALVRLARRVAELGTLRAVAHAAGVSPTMDDWRQMFSVDLVGTAQLIEELRPLAVSGSAFVCFASMAPHLAFAGARPEADSVLDAPLAPDFLARIRAVLGEEVENAGVAYAWAKRGVQRLVQQEAVRLGPVGARICCVSPGVIDTPMGRQEAASNEFMALLVERTPLGREGRAEEIASVVAFLLSDDASFATGIDVLVDGGVCAALRGPSATG